MRTWSQSGRSSAIRATIVELAATSRVAGLPGEGLSGDSKEVQANSPVVLEGNLIMIRAADPEWKNIVNAETF